MQHALVGIPLYQLFISKYILVPACNKVLDNSEIPFQNTLHMHKQIVTILINLVVMLATV